MFCQNCGSQIPDGANFCASCGAVCKAAAPEAAAPAEYFMPAPEPKKKGKGKMVGGIIMLVLGVLSVYGGFVNGSFADMMEYGFALSDIITIALEAGLILGGIVLIVKGVHK